MSKWHDNVDWFWLGLILFMLVIGIGEAVERQQKNDLIKACIAQNKAAVYEHNEFKECK